MSRPESVGASYCRVYRVPLISFCRRSDERLGFRGRHMQPVVQDLRDEPSAPPNTAVRLTTMFGRHAGAGKTTAKKLQHRQSAASSIGNLPSVLIRAPAHQMKQVGKFPRKQVKSDAAAIRAVRRAPSGGGFLQPLPRGAAIRFCRAVVFPERDHLRAA